MNAEILAAQMQLYARELKMPGLAGAFEEILRDGGREGRSGLPGPRRLPRRRGRLASRAPSGGAHQSGPLPGAEDA